jgi:hypothetical protein
MAIEKNQTYKTTTGLLLRVKTVRRSGMHTLELVDEKGNALPERKNTAGHIIKKSERMCSEETIKSYQKINN